MTPGAVRHPRAPARPSHPLQGRRRPTFDCLLLLCAPWATEAAILSPGQTSGHSDEHLCARSRTGRLPEPHRRLPARRERAASDPDGHVSPQCQVSSRGDAEIADCLLLLCAPWATEAAMLSPGQISGHSTPTNTPALGDTLLPPTNISARRQARSEDPTARRHPSVRAIRLVPLRENRATCRGYTTRARQRHWSVVPRHLRTQ